MPPDFAAPAERPEQRRVAGERADARLGVGNLTLGSVGPPVLTERDFVRHGMIADQMAFISCAPRQIDICRICELIAEHEKAGAYTTTRQHLKHVWRAGRIGTIVER